jgi:hypothetical protein
MMMGNGERNWDLETIIFTYLLEIKNSNRKNNFNGIICAYVLGILSNWGMD